MIRLQQIKKSFQDKAGINYVLRGIDLDVMEGEFISIMGTFRGREITSAQYPWDV